MIEKNKLTDLKKAEQTRRTELAMMNHLIEKYPKEIQEKTRKLFRNSENLPARINKSL